MRFLVLFSLLFSSFAWGQMDSRASAVRNLEEGYKKSILELATVQFGTTDAVAVLVRIGLKKDPPPPQTQPQSEDLDVGYLPIPASRAEVVAPPSTDDILKNIETIEVSIYASALLERSALNTFQSSVNRMFGKFPVKVNLQAVKYTDLNARKKPPEPKEKEKDKTKEKEDAKNLQLDKDELSKKTMIYLALGSFLMAAVFVGLMIFMGIGSLSRAIRVGAMALGQGVVQMKQTGSVLSKSDGKGEGSGNKVVLGGAGEGDASALISRPGSVDQCLQILRKYCKSEPMKVVACLKADSVVDQLGIRWLLSQLPDEDQIQIKNFLGMDRIKSLAQPMTPPPGFSLLIWSQDFIERITLRRLEGAASLEKALSSEDLSFLYQVSEDAAFESARELASPEAWRLALEVLTPSSLTARSSQITPTDWQVILNAMQVDPSSLKFSFSLFRRKVEAMKTASAPTEVDPQFEVKVISPLIDSIKLMPFGKDEDFIFALKRSHPDIVQQIRKRFWTFEDLRNVEPASLQSFIANLGNEALLALLLVSSDRDRDIFKQYIPEGMKRTVVLDLFEKAKAKADPKEVEKSIAAVRDILEKAYKLNQSGRLPTSKKLLAA